MEEEDDSSDADSAITGHSDRNASRAARRKVKPLIAQKSGKRNKGKAPAGKSMLQSRGASRNGSLRIFVQQYNLSSMSQSGRA